MSSDGQNMLIGVTDESANDAPLPKAARAAIMADLAFRMLASGARIPMLCRTAAISCTWPFPPFAHPPCQSPRTPVLALIGARACSATNLSVFHRPDGPPSPR